jgi:ketosteroid isomerase-like protein
MAHSNKDLVREAYAAFGRGDMDALRDKYFTDNVCYHVTGRSPLAGDYEGIDQVLQFFRPGLRGAGRHVQLRAA